MAKWFITLGLVFLVLGLAWPLFSKRGLGPLPGDLRIEREAFTFDFPITSGVVGSLLVTLVLWIFPR